MISGERLRNATRYGKTISTRRFCGSRTPSGVGPRGSFIPRPATRAVSVARYAKPPENRSHGIRATLREPLVVAGGTRKIGVAGDLDLNRTTRLVMGYRGLEDLHPLGRDVIFIPVEEHQVDLMGWRRRWCGRRWRRCRRRRRAKHHRQAGDDILRTLS